jgi:hypothetical protein
MPTERFDLLFSGKLMDGQDPAAARDRLRRLFKASDAHMVRLFSGKPVAVKKGVDMETASKYRLAFRQAGALLDIRTSTDMARQPEPAAAVPEAPGMTLAPPNTGSLAEFAPKLEAVPLPDISGLDMSAVGAALDETPTPAPIHIDTGNLSMVENHGWTLDDCQPPPLPEVLPDIDDLELVAPDDESHIPPEPPPLPLPDTSGMTLEEPEDLTPEEK